MTTKELVHEAALLMDEEKPGWERNIDFNTLVMHDFENCIAGQNKLDYGRMHSKLWDRVPYSPEAHTPFGGSDSVVPLWKAEVEDRLSKNQAPMRIRDVISLALSACLPFLF